MPQYRLCISFAFFALEDERSCQVEVRKQEDEVETRLLYPYGRPYFEEAKFIGRAKIRVLLHQERTRSANGFDYNPTTTVSLAACGCRLAIIQANSTAAARCGGGGLLSLLVLRDARSCHAACRRLQEFGERGSPLVGWT